MQSAIRWYDTFKGCLDQLGFKLNKYDPCVVNKVIKGEQYTGYWYVDNANISHKNNKLVDVVIKEIEDKFGKMVVNREHEHNF